VNFAQFGLKRMKGDKTIGFRPLQTAIVSLCKTKRFSDVASVQPWDVGISSMDTLANTLAPFFSFFDTKQPLFIEGPTWGGMLADWGSQIEIFGFR
jgi:hypothetical protein